MGMRLKGVSGLMLTLLLVSMLHVVFDVPVVVASGTIYIRADGSIDPPTAPISTVDNITYTFTGDINDSIVIERDNIVVDGAGYTVQGTGAEQSKGIDISVRSNITIKNTKITSFWYGIYTYPLLIRSTLLDNTITENCFGVWHSVSSYNTISRNNITANNDHGMVVYESSNNTISGNNITANNGYGLWLVYSLGNSISGNNITNNGYGYVNNGVGIDLLYSSYNSVSGNKITNSNYGVRVGESSDNTIYHNNFKNNTQQVCDLSWDDPQDFFPSINVWDDCYPSGGNFWSNYVGTDIYHGPNQNETGSDGMGDAPYVLDTNNMDNFPLMKPYPWASHDIGITDAAVSRSVVGWGYNTTINIMAFNYGNYTETINFTVYANEKAIGEINNVDIASRNFTIVTFAWNTFGFAKGNYTIGAYAWPVLGETDLADNSITDGWVLVTKVGDIGGGEPPQFFKCDGVVDDKDLELFIQCYKGTAPAEAMYLGDLGGGPPPQFFKCDGRVDGSDLTLFVKCYKGLGPDKDDDVAVASITPSKTVVGQGYSFSINVTVENQGDYTETLNVTIYANTTTIATATNITLTSGNSTTITFTWNTTGFAKGNYTISAYAWPVQGETDKTDNTYTEGTVRVTMPGDCAPEYGTVNIFDIVAVGVCFGAEYGKPPPPGTQPYNPNADIKEDKIIDIFDIVAIGIHFGETDP